MKTLHKAALIRAYRTLAQGLAGGAVTTALVALVSGQTSAGSAALVALGTATVTAFASFWSGVAKGLPEATDDTNQR